MVNLKLIQTNIKEHKSIKTTAIIRKIQCNKKELIKEKITYKLKTALIYKKSNTNFNLYKNYLKTNI